MDEVLSGEKSEEQNKKRTPLNFSKSLIAMLCIGMSILIIFISLGYRTVSIHASYSHILISEVMSGNRDALTASIFTSPDWIELYNPTD